MLDQLFVKNLVVVQELNIEFKNGMTVVTGETGAGKSIIIQALSLVVGGRSDASLVRDGASKSEIVATFSIDIEDRLQSLLENLDLENGTECILRRIISADGKSRSYVNGSNVPLSTLRDIGGYLIDMHGQNEHQLLLRSNQHRILLDDYAITQDLCEEVNSTVYKYQQIQNEIEDLTKSNELLSTQKELLSHQLNELLQIDTTQDELDSIEDDYRVSVNASLLVEKISKILESLDHESGVNNILIDGERSVEQSRQVDSRLDSIQSLLSSAQVQVQESIYDLTDYLNKIGGIEDNSAELTARINILHELGRKHNCQIQELLSVQTNLQAQLDDLGSSNEKLEELLIKQNQCEKNYYSKSKLLSEKRLTASKSLSKKVTDIMQNLGMPGSEIDFSIKPLRNSIRLNGMEEIIIHVKTNTGQELKPLNKVASGGELSRISLALSVVTSNSELIPSIVFDEVDVGISGSVAEIVGQMLKKLSTHYQIICVTHLAQVAAQGKEHLKVVKIQKNGATFTHVTDLSLSQRTEEVARILGGITISDKTRIAAEEMIKSSA
ncbi:MAG: DNA repair protein RecN [Candidatus Thioglobus sp.]|jgi:DNA repair protein RecN (Recombination protein N)|nr:DNA repair protein RecN [Candidatus Thioglobus sp.]|tara:strand:- start:1536 stop:3197 length:1662 start_codon:yes stop_codon:yes gene_type:complete